MTTPKLPDPATGAMKVVAWWVEAIGLGQREKPHPSYNPEPLVRLSDAQALAGEVERLRARLAFLTDPEALRFVEKDSGLYRVYEDKASPENALHFWQSMTYLFYPTAEEAIDAALDASRALATQEAK